jgi:putative glutathione S-transferase
MGLLIDGTWHDHWYDTASTRGQFVRSAAKFRNFVTADGAAGPSGTGGFRAEAGRYHLVVSYACPWAHRTLIVRALKGLESVVSVSAVDAFMGDEGWTFGEDPDDPRSARDELVGATRLHQLYTAADPGYSGRVTVPVLWDRERRTIVSNESSEIIRMFGSAFDGLGARPLDLYPEQLRAEIDRLNARIYEAINDGVYRAGFATSQAAYEAAARALFVALDEVEALLGERRYLAGDVITEADWRLFTTLVRFDPVYHQHFKCSMARIADYPHLRGYTRELAQWPGVAETIHMDHIRTHYFRSHPSINPHRIIPLAPPFELWAPHGRDGVGGGRAAPAAPRG